jgi:hypothetical protein
MPKPSPAGNGDVFTLHNGLSPDDADILGALVLKGRDEAAALSRMTPAAFDQHVHRLMFSPAARAALARLLDAKVTAQLAPRAVQVTLELMEKAASDRTRLAAARQALELCGALATDRGMPSAAKAAVAAAVEANTRPSEDLRGLPAEALLERIEAAERSLAVMARTMPAEPPAFDADGTPFQGW